MHVRIIAIIFPVFGVVLIGWLHARGTAKKPLELAFAHRLTVDVFLPALVFAALADKSFDVRTNWRLAVGAVIIIGGSGVIGWILTKVLRVSAKTLVPPLMFGNVANLGLPIAVLAFGEDALAPAVVLTLVSTVIHFSFGVWLLDREKRLLDIWRVPVVLASVAGITVSVAHIPIWPPLMATVKMLGEPTLPFLLFALGVRLASSNMKAVKVGIGGAIAKPLAGMALGYVAAGLVGFSGAPRAMLVVFGALPPAVLNYVLAERYDQEPDSVASIVLIGNLVAIVFVPLALALVL